MWCAFWAARLNSRGGGWGCLKSHALCQTGFWRVLVPGLIPSRLKLTGSLECSGGEGGGGVVSSWVSCCCTDTGLSCGVHLG